MDKWDKRFMELAETVAGWSSCYQENRHIGAPAGVSTCAERRSCLRREQNIPSGTCQEICYAVHAEQNAIIQAAKLGVSVDGGTLYCTHQPCVICARMIINAGIRRVVYRHGYPDAFSLQLFSEAGLTIEKYTDPESDA